MNEEKQDKKIPLRDAKENAPERAPDTSLNELPSENLQNDNCDKKAQSFDSQNNNNTNNNNNNNNVGSNVNKLCSKQRTRNIKHYEKYRYILGRKRWIVH